MLLPDDLDTHPDAGGGRPSRSTSSAATLIGRYFGRRLVDQHGRAGLYRRAGDLRLPTLLIWGADDEVTPISALDEVRTLPRPATVHVVERCGHLAPFERPAEVAAQLAAFTASHPDRSDP
jgi:pimeloyl-ACP methyl ester carboxylesterase